MPDGNELTADTSRIEPYRPLFPASRVATQPTLKLDSGRVDASELNAEKLVTDGGCSSREGTEDGLIGELAFGEYLPFEAEPDTNIYENGDGGWDFRVGRHKVDVKTVGLDTERTTLRVDAGPLRADYYVLADRIGYNACRLVGYAPRWLVKRMGKRSGRYGPYYDVSPEFLWPLPPHLE